jgi:hypothetical protein
MQAVAVPNIQMHAHLETRVEKLEAKNRMMVPDAFTATLPTEVSREKAAEFLKLDIRTVDRMIKEGLLLTKRVGPKKGKVLVEAISLFEHKESKGFTRDHIDLLFKDLVYGT